MGLVSINPVLRNIALRWYNRSRLREALGETPEYVAAIPTAAAVCCCCSKRCGGTNVLANRFSPEDSVVPSEPRRGAARVGMRMGADVPCVVKGVVFSV